MIYHMSIKKTVLDEKEVDKRAQDMMSAEENALYKKSKKGRLFVLQVWGGVWMGAVVSNLLFTLSSPLPHTPLLRF